MAASEGLPFGAQECERQALIRELYQLRREGVNVERQDVIERSLRRNWKLGWPPVLAMMGRGAHLPGCRWAWDGSPCICDRGSGQTARECPQASGPCEESSTSVGECRWCYRKLEVS